MALFLVQHGKSLPKEIDPDSPLTEEGREITERIARYAAQSAISVSVIKHSGKTRAKQTAEIMAYFLKPEGGVYESKGIGPLDDVTEIAKTADPGQNMMIVGHLPFMERLVSSLITGFPERTVIKFQNSGIVCLDKAPDTGCWFIKWTLMPGIA